MVVLRSLTALLAAGLLLAPAAALPEARPGTGAFAGVAGRLLVAAPSMPDPRFAGTVLYMVHHDAGGAFGVVVNRPLGDGPLDKLVKGFGLDPGRATGDVTLHHGGPVETGLLLVLHSRDWRGPSTRGTVGPLALTADAGVFAALAEGGGPSRYVVVLGYAGWGPGQLEGEMARKDWLTAPATADFVFDGDAASKWERAVALAGVPL